MDHPPNQKEISEVDPLHHFHNATWNKRGRELFLFLPECCFHSVGFYFFAWEKVSSGKIRIRTGYKRHFKFRIFRNHCLLSTFSMSGTVASEIFIVEICRGLKISESSKED